MNLAVTTGSYNLLAISALFFLALPAGRIWVLDARPHPLFRKKTKRGKWLAKVLAVLS